MVEVGEEGAVSPKERLTRAADVGKHLRRVLRGYRSYAPDHEVLVRHRGELYDRLLALLQVEDPVVFDITARTLVFEETVVVEAEEREEGITLPLFLDGVQRLTFLGGIERSEIDALLDLWWLAIAGKDAQEQSFITRFWEAELQHVSLVAVETFVQGDEREEENVDAGVRQQEHVEAVMQQLAGERLAGGARGPAAQLKVLRVTREDLAVLALDEVASLDGDRLERYDQAKVPSVPGLDPASRGELLAEARVPMRDGVDRLLVAFLDTLDLEDTQGEERVRTLAARLFGSLARAGAFGALAQAVRRAMAFARGDPSAIDRRCRALVPVLEGLADAQTIEAVVAALDDPEAWEEAATVLAFLPVASAGALLERLASVQTAGGRAALCSVVERMKPSGETLARVLAGARSREALALLQVARAIGADRLEAVLVPARTHPDTSVRRAVVEILTEDTEAHLSELLALLEDEDEEIRRQALDALMRVRARGLVRPLRALLERRDVGAGERHRIVVALGRIGGREASLALQHELKSTESVEARLAAIRALGQTRDRSAILALKAAASGWLTSKEIKTAAQEAIERLSKGGR
jgi:HEAT repeat protein